MATGCVAENTIEGCSKPRRSSWTTVFGDQACETDNPEGAQTIMGKMSVYPIQHIVTTDAHPSMMRDEAEATHLPA